MNKEFKDDSLSMFMLGFIFKGLMIYTGFWMIAMFCGLAPIAIPMEIAAQNGTDAGLMLFIVNGPAFIVLAVFLYINDGEIK